MRYISILILLFTLSACSNIGRKGEYEFIAHAAGAIDGKTYTNSLEALNNAVEKGYRYIELDFIFTADSVLVAAHSWEKFNEITGCSHLGDTAPALADFLSRRIYSTYTPITAADAQRFFLAHDSLFLVADKISDAKVLNRYFSLIKNRTVVEAFSYTDYQQLLDEGYFRVLYSCMASDVTYSFIKHLVLNKLFPGKKIEWVALHTSVYEKLSFKIVDALSDYKAALFTVNDTTDIPVDFKQRVYMIYTDSIRPGK